MAAILRSRTLWAALVLILAYWAPALLLPYETFGELVNSVRFALAVIVIATYFPLALDAIASPRVGGTQQLVLGIMMAWASVAGLSMWGAGMRLIGNSASIAESPVTGWLVWVSMLGAILHITAPDAAVERFPLRNWGLVLAGVAAGSAIAGALAAFTIMSQ